MSDDERARTCCAGPGVGLRASLIRGAVPAVVALALLGACTVGTPVGTAPPPPSALPVPTLSPAPAPAGDSPSSATDLQSAFVRVVKLVGPSVVQIETDQGLGSGVVFDSRGDIVTNDHVVKGGTTYRVTLTNGRSYPATVVGEFAADDLAVVRISAPDLRPAVFADSSKLLVGDIVMAIGNPLGLRSSVTEGIVSAVGRTVPEGNGVTLPDLVQTSASINPGNSGGALVDLLGQVVGIPTLAAVDQQMGGSAPGIGFAISSNTARDIANQLITNGRVTNSHRAYLGVRIGDASSGVYVGAVTPGGPADRAGIRAGDVITAVDGKATPDTGALATVLAGLQPGQTVDVQLTRAAGTTTTVSLTLGQLPGG